MRCVDALVIQCPPQSPPRSLIILPSSRFSHLLELLEPSSLELFNSYSPPLGSVGDEIQFELIDPFFCCTDHQLILHGGDVSLLVFHTALHCLEIWSTCER
jgi:hypothetical protein